MKVKLPGYQKHQERLREKYLRIATDINAGMTVAEVAKRYGYSRNNVYLIVKRLRNTPIN